MRSSLRPALLQKASKTGTETARTRIRPYCRRTRFFEVRLLAF
jgi:hypothetical protein